MWLVASKPRAPLPSKWQPDGAPVSAEIHHPLKDPARFTLFRPGHYSPDIAFLVVSGAGCS